MSVSPVQNILKPSPVPGPSTVYLKSGFVAAKASATPVEIGSTVEEPETLIEPVTAPGGAALDGGAGALAALAARCRRRRSAADGAVVAPPPPQAATSSDRGEREPADALGRCFDGHAVTPPMDGRRSAPVGVCCRCCRCHASVGAVNEPCVCAVKGRATLRGRRAGSRAPRTVRGARAARAGLDLRAKPADVDVDCPHPPPWCSVPQTRSRSSRRL